MLTLTVNGHLTSNVELCTTRSGKHVAYELHDVTLEYGAKPRGLAAIAAANADTQRASA